MSALHDIWKDRYLSIRIYQYSVLLYAAEAWTPRAIDIKALEAFHMKCQRQLLQISWQQFIRNDEVAVTTGLPSISEVISNRRNALFGHVARLQQDVPAHKARPPLPRRPVSWSTTQRPVETSSGPTTREMDRRGPEGQWNPPQRICGGVRRVVVTDRVATLRPSLHGFAITTTPVTDRRTDGR